MKEERFSASNELLDRQDIELLLATLKTKFEERVRQHFFTICHANELIENYVDFFADKPDCLLRLLFWKNQKQRFYSLRQTCLVEKFQKEYADKNNYLKRDLMDKLCDSLNLRYCLPQDFFFHLSCQESDFIKEIKGFLKMIKDKNLNSENFSKIVPQEHRDFMFQYDLYKEKNGEYTLTDRGYNALEVPYTHENLERYHLQTFMAALNAPRKGRKIVM